MQATSAFKHYIASRDGLTAYWAHCITFPLSLLKFVTVSLISFQSIHFEQTHFKSAVLAFAIVHGYLIETVTHTLEPYYRLVL